MPYWSCQNFCLPHLIHPWGSSECSHCIRHGERSGVRFLLKWPSKASSCKFAASPRCKYPTSQMLNCCQTLKMVNALVEVQMKVYAQSPPDCSAVVLHKSDWVKQCVNTAGKSVQHILEGALHTDGGYYVISLSFLQTWSLTGFLICLSMYCINIYTKTVMGDLVTDSIIKATFLA